MENLLLRGRYKKEQGNIQFFNTGSGVSLYVKARSVTLELSTLKKSCFIYVIIDHDYSKKKKYYVDVKAFIKLNLPDENPHYLDVIKANESMDNTLVLHNIKIEGKSLKFPENHRKFVKVYGDSTIAGYGILGHEGVPDIDTNDGVEDFCFRALYELDLDFDIFAASGWGLTFSAYTSPKEIGIEKYIENLCVNSNERWVSKKADLLIISLGTNDVSCIEENIESKEELTSRFIDSFAKLIEKERKNNKDFPVLIVYGSLKEEQAYWLIEKTFDELTKKMTNIYIVKLPGDNTGLSNHSYVSYHENMAKVLEEKIVSIIR